VNNFSLIGLANHLCQSTLFALVAACLTLLLRKNSARVRYCLWLAGSVKFLVPFALLTAVGAQIPWSLGNVQPTHFISIAGQMAVQVTQFGGTGATALVAHAKSMEVIPITLGALWILGTLAVLARSLTQWMLVYRALQESTQASQEFVIPVRLSALQLEPAVVGILRPTLLLPKGLDQRLAPEEIRALLAHERCHVAWRDNFAAALHMFVEALFWFHPLIWWLGAQLVAERERACDEQVLAAGHLPATYAEGILKVCEHYLESRLPCVAGVSGANLRQRIEVIMQNQMIEKLGPVRKLLIIVMAAATIVAPLAIGVLISPHARAQAGTPAIEDSNVVSVKSAKKLATPESFTVNFYNADIGTIIAAVATATHKTFIVDPQVRRANVTMRSSAPITPTAMYEAFQSVLAVHGFMQVPGAGGTIKIVPYANQDRVNTPADEIVTQVILVKHASAVQLATMLRPLVPPTGQIMAYSQTNMITISDHASIVDSVMMIIARIDEVGDPKSVAGSRQDPQ
jgi:beta-lactamase regulating signal transducer with metallopeptidase domain